MVINKDKKNWCKYTQKKKWKNYKIVVYDYLEAESYNNNNN